MVFAEHSVAEHSKVEAEFSRRDEYKTTVTDLT